MPITKTSVLSLLLCTGAMLLSGCGTAGLNMNFMAEKHQKESPDNPVEQLIPVWKEGEGPGLDTHSVSRGFNGQIYFITQHRGLPSEVNGDVRIYVFDNQGTAEDLTKPIHQFDFNASTWNAHMIMTKLGPAYSVFVPYTRPGRNAAECAVRIRYTPANGPPVFSQMVTITMPGVEVKTEAEEAAKKVAIPSLTKRGPPALRKVTQVSATGDLIDLQRVQTAAYETTPRTPQTAARVRLSDSAPQTKPRAVDARRAFLGDNTDDEESEAEEDAVADEVLSRLAGRGQDLPAQTEPDEVAAPPEEEVEEAEEERSVKAFTIPLD